MIADDRHRGSLFPGIFYKPTFSSFTQAGHLGFGRRIRERMMRTKPGLKKQPVRINLQGQLTGASSTVAMKIAHFGATGNVGSRIAAEALRRGHQVTAIARAPGHLQTQANWCFQRGDMNHEGEVAHLAADHDAVFSSVKFQALQPRVLLAWVKQGGVKRLLVVGGAGSLEVAPGVQLVDTPEFPEAYKSEALPGRDFLNLLRGEMELEWTFVCPSAEFAPGTRTGKFRLGKDRLLMQPTGESRISMEDFAIAFLDEFEHPKHIRERFTVGY
jgi:putative NADH-flavin reductase